MIIYFIYSRYILDRPTMPDFYAVTLSPPCRRFSDIYQCREDFLILRYLQRYCDHYIIIPELSPTTRLHYHGIIGCSRSDMIKRVKPFLRRKFNFIKIEFLKTFKDHLRYLLYCKKDWYLNRCIFDNIFTPYTRLKWRRKRKNNKSMRLNRIPPTGMGT